MLDTHSLLWWASSDKQHLTAKAIRAIEKEMDGGQIVVSTMSSWEIAMLVDRGRVALSMDVDQWLATVGQIDAVQFVAPDNAIMVTSVGLPGDFHKDPADRIIVATARKFAAPLVTADEKIRAYEHVRTIW